MKIWLCGLVLVAVVVEAPRVAPVVATASVETDADDPAIWIHPTKPEESLVFGTDKVSESGALWAFGLDGKVRSVVHGLDRPNNVDVAYGLAAKGGAFDVAVVTERNKRRLKIYRISPNGDLNDVSGATQVFVGEEGNRGAPMGIALYKRPRDGSIFAIVSRKTGPADGYLWQYRLVPNDQGEVDAVKVRAFGAFGGVGEIEAVCVDDEFGHVYYADENTGVRKYAADPDAKDAGRELALFAIDGFTGDREGIAIYALDAKTGYVVVCEQLPENSVFHVYRREGATNDPHDHTQAVARFSGGSDSTDGIEATSRRLGPRFPRGVVVAMNSKDRNFLLYSWDDIVQRVSLRARKGE